MSNITSTYIDVSALSIQTSKDPTTDSGCAGTQANDKWLKTFETLESSTNAAGNSIIYFSGKDKTPVFEVNLDTSIVKMYVEGEYIEINDLLGQLAHESY